MSVSAHYDENADQLVINVSGKFNFDLHREFRDAYAAVDLAAIDSVLVDLSVVGYMDSSALGMLLVMRELAGGDKANLPSGEHVPMCNRYWMSPDLNSYSILPREPLINS